LASHSSFDCVDEVPLHWVRANQLGILLCVIAAVAAQLPWILLVALVVQLMTRWLGIKYNVFVRLFAPLLPASLKSESRELLRFNNLLAILFLCVTLIAAALGWTVLAYVSLAMLSVAVVLALCGFCLGCFMYFQWKQFRRRRLTP